MSVIPSPLIGLETLPTQDQLWALEYLFACNWKDGLRLSNNYTTDIVKSLEDTEQRWGLVTVPYRTLSASILARGQANVVRLRNLLARAGLARWLVPLYTDEAYLLAAGAGNTYNVTTTDKRFFVGARVAIVKYNSSRDTVIAMQVSTIMAKTSGTLVIADPVNGAFLKGHSVFPLIEAELSLSDKVAIITDEVLQIDFEAIESNGNYSLDTFQAAGDLPSGMPTFDNLLILNTDPDFREKLEFGVVRNGSYTQIGRGKSLQTFGDRARWSYNLAFKGLARDEAVNLIEFFEAVAGRLQTFWLVSPIADLKVTSITGTLVTVNKIGPELDWDYYTHIAITEKSGTVTIRAINSVVRIGSSDVIGVDEISPAIALSSIQRCSFVHKVRLDSDEMVEEWITDSVMATSFSCLEVVNDDDLTIDNIEDLSEGVGFVEPPEITLQPQHTVIDEGDTATFTVQAIGTEPLVYEWERTNNDGVNWTPVGTNSNILQIPGATEALYQVNRFRVTVSNSAGEVLSNEAELRIRYQITAQTSFLNSVYLRIDNPYLTPESEASSDPGTLGKTTFNSPPTPPKMQRSRKMIRFSLPILSKFAWATTAKLRLQVASVSTTLETFNVGVYSRTESTAPVAPTGDFNGDFYDLSGSRGDFEASVVPQVGVAVEVSVSVLRVKDHAGATEYFILGTFEELNGLGLNTPGGRFARYALNFLLPIKLLIGD